MSAGQAVPMTKNPFPEQVEAPFLEGRAFRDVAQVSEGGFVGETFMGWT